MKKSIALVLVLIVIFCLVISTMLFAANLTDISGTKYETAVNYLVDKGIVNGYPDNTFRPNGEITRAEATKMVITAADKLSGDPSGEIITFSDVASGHWALATINAATSLGIVNGYEDGTFNPDGKVTYAEATAMVIRAMGYDEDVKQREETWPDNYISYARTLNLYSSISTFDANQQATRGDIAILIYNMVTYINNGYVPYTPTEDENISGEVIVPQEQSSEEEEELEEGPLGYNKVLVVYFSHIDNTDKLAEKIHDEVGGDIVEIKTTDDYVYPTDEEELKIQILEEQEYEMRPAIATQIEDIGKYDIVFIGYPVWEGRAPMAIYSFMQDFSVQAEHVLPFYTFSGDNDRSSETDLKEFYDYTNFYDGLAIENDKVDSSATKTQIEKWIDTIKLDEE